MSEQVSRILVERDVPARMRDGTVLRADIYRPEGEGRYPVLLQRTPYSKAFLPFATMTMDPIAVAHAGYVVIIQDVRGRFQSEGGPFYLYRDEFNDGYDSVEWAASLPCSTGAVGMFGASYMGMTQWQAAVMQPPHLRAIFPVTSATDLYFYRGGALELGLLANWVLNSIGPNALMRLRAGEPALLQHFMELVQHMDHMEEALRHVPPGDGPALRSAAEFAPFVRDLLAHDRYDQYHEAMGVTQKHSLVKVPALILAGWYDLLLGSDLNHFGAMRAEGASGRAREQTRLMVGPWAHAGFAGAVGERNFGLAASGMLLELRQDLTALHLRWFDYWLKGIENGVTKEPPVKIFVMGENRWRAEQEWPLARTRYTPFYFHSGGSANSARGDGFLSLEPPGEEPPDQYLYNPENPVPTRGGNHLLPMHYQRGPMDQAAVQAREDVLVYISAPLTVDLEVTGPVKVKLFAASSACDTDFTAKLVEIHPDGRAFNLADGIIRARYRHGPTAPAALIEPGAVVAYEIDLLATSNLFRQGHRIGVEISSSNFPRFERNPNTGEDPREARRLQSARQTIYHDARYPSHILLPIIPREGGEPA